MDIQAANGGVFIYPGSFDPVTNGHLDIVARASKLCGELIVAIGRNREKKTLFTVAERIMMLREAIKGLSLECPNIRVASFDGLLADFARVRGASVIVKGLRAMSDFEIEFQMALTNKFLDDKLETIFMMTSIQFTYLSSSNVKELAQNGASLEGLVPPNVAAALLLKATQRQTNVYN
jgi:pantetheine-phosphate adenylyltransferase